MKTLKEMIAEARQVVPEEGPAELKRRLDAKEPIAVIDVRDPDEFEIANLSGVNIPLAELPDRLAELSKDKEVIIHCHYGGRSQRAALYLKAQGFANVKNLSGGINAWSLKIDGSVPRY